MAGREPAAAQGFHSVVEEPHLAVGHDRHEIAEYPSTCSTCREERDLCECPDGCDIHGTEPRGDDDE